MWLDQNGIKFHNLQMLQGIPTPASQNAICNQPVLSSSNY